MELRRLGSTGVDVSPIGFGGIVAAGMNREEADSILGEALDAGVRYVDAAPSYGDCEEVLGGVLDGRRDGLFLACKTTEREADGSRSELETSLRRLRTDHFDLYQIHGISTIEQVDTVFGAGGAMETLIAAREEGKTRFLGFSAHSEEAALAMMDRFRFDTILFPTNWVCWFEAGFGPRVLERAKEKGMGLLALKAMARQAWPEDANREQYPKCWYQPEDDPDTARLALRFAWTQGISTCMPPGAPEMLRLALRLAAMGVEPLDDDELTLLREKARGLKPIFPH
jgi:aryl-alcohol dehydrogenase-like predicted oxidoreductase